MTLELAKEKAAEYAIDNHIKTNQIVGIGSGSTIVYGIKRLAKRIKEENLNIICIPSSFQAKQLILEYQLKLGDLNTYPIIDIVIDGADEVDNHLNCIKGGGACHLQEKLLIYNSKECIIIADYTKNSNILGTKWLKGIPIEIIPMAYASIQNKLKMLFNISTIHLRMGINKAGPIITDNGNFIIDVQFNDLTNPKKLENDLLLIPGILEVGLFCNLVTKAYFGNLDGEVITKEGKKE